MIGTREPAKLDGWLRHAGPGGQIGTFAEAAQFGEIVRSSTPIATGKPTTPSG